MNFYKHHLGDYAADTSHLSWDEDCAYRRLLDQYYKRGAPIPTDIDEVFRLIRAKKLREKNACSKVLREFFVSTERGWIQKRCEEEIEHAKAQALINKQIAEHREAAKRARSVHESSTVKVKEREPSHKPLAISQIPEANNQIKPKAKEKEASPTAPLDVDAQVWADWTKFRKRRKADVTATVVEEIRREALKANVTLEVALRMSIKRGWTGFEAEWVTGKHTNGKHGSGKQAELEQRNQEAGEEWLRRHQPPEREPEIFDDPTSERTP